MSVLTRKMTGELRPLRLDEKTLASYLFPDSKCLTSNSGLLKVIFRTRISTSDWSRVEASSSELDDFKYLSSMVNNCVRPPSNPGEQLTTMVSALWFNCEQFDTLSGRPATKIYSIELID